MCYENILLHFVSYLSLSITLFGYGGVFILDYRVWNVKWSVSKLVRPMVCGVIVTAVVLLYHVRVA